MFPQENAGERVAARWDFYLAVVVGRVFLLFYSRNLNNSAAAPLNARIMGFERIKR